MVHQRIKMKQEQEEWKTTKTSLTLIWKGYFNLLCRKRRACFRPHEQVTQNNSFTFARSSYTGFGCYFTIKLYKFSTHILKRVWLKHQNILVRSVTLMPLRQRAKASFPSQLPTAPKHLPEEWRSVRLPKPRNKVGTQQIGTTWERERRFHDLCCVMIMLMFKLIWEGKNKM